MAHDDVNVLDADKVAERQPELVHDFPGGAPRFIQRSTGCKATIVNGEISVVDGEHTGARAGRVLRHACTARASTERLRMPELAHLLLGIGFELRARRLDAGQVALLE